MSPPVLLWFQQDLRLSDHPALTAATESGQPVIPLYILDDHSPGPWKRGGASRWWLYHSLEALQKALAEKESSLTLRRGKALDILPDLMQETGAAAIYTAELWEPWARKRDAVLKKHFDGQLRFHPGTTLFAPNDIRTGSGTPYKVFTPFWKACRERGLQGKALPPPAILRAPDDWPASDDLKSLELLPEKPDWSSGLRGRWDIGEAAAREKLDIFLEDKAAHYSNGRDWPSLDATSSLSPHLHFGEISPRQIWQAVEAKVFRDGDSTGLQTFLSEVGWREFFYHILFHAPHMPEKPLRSAYDAFPWRADPGGLKKWQQGRTGYPIVDAGMRELWHTGTMHNRVRMIAASFLIKHLLIPWQKGEAWFWDTLVDADLANNAGNWQWVAGCGSDAAPYFRIFNPITQGQKFDPDGLYIRKWVPELKDIPNKYIHTPWTAPDRLKPSDYPPPMVDHKVARERALEAYKSIK